MLMNVYQIFINKKLQAGNGVSWRERATAVDYTFIDGLISFAGVTASNSARIGLSNTFSIVAPSSDRLH